MTATPNRIRPPSRSTQDQAASFIARIPPQSKPKPAFLGPVSGPLHFANPHPHPLSQWERGA